MIGTGEAYTAVAAGGTTHPPQAVCRTMQPPQAVSLDHAPTAVRVPDVHPPQAVCRTMHPPQEPVTVGVWGLGPQADMRKSQVRALRGQGTRRTGAGDENRTRVISLED